MAALLLWPSTSWGADLDVSPVRLHLSESHRSTVLSMRNRGSETVRYQISAEAWQQSESGEMVMTPTRDLVFFPSILEIAPGETRRIRVATTSGATGIERSYRLRAEPLPDGTSAQAGAVRVLTRFSIPVFVQPRVLEPEAAASVRVEGGRVIVSVTNPGNSYFVSHAVQVEGRSSSGATLVEEELPGWYVLAHGERVYEVPLTPAACAALSNVIVTLTTEDATTRASVSVDAAHCRP
jgi:fimbrial chaperone protein